MIATQHSIANILKAQGWTEDRFGNLKAKSGVTRIKFQATSMRVERKVTYKETFPGYTPPPEWKNIVNDYYKNIVIDADANVIIQGRKIKAQNSSAE